MEGNVRLRYRVEKGGPASSRLILRIAGKELCTATTTQIDTLFVVVPVRSGERTFGTLLARDAKLVIREFLAPLLIGLRDLFHR